MSLSALQAPPPRIARPIRAAERHGGQVVALLPDLRRYALKLARNRFDAEDLVQDTVERALAKRHQFTEGTALRSWLFTILRNRFLSDCRDRRRWGDAEDFADAMAEASVPASQEASSHLESVRRAFVTLPRRDQLVIELAGLRGLNYDQVSGMLKVPSGTVRSRLSRARKRLSQIVEGGAAGAPA